MSDIVVEEWRLYDLAGQIGILADLPVGDDERILDIARRAVEEAAGRSIEVVR